MNADSADMIQIGHSLTEVDVSIIRGMLDAEGIACEVAQEATTSGQMGPALSVHDTFAIFVESSDAEAAREWVDDYLKRTRSDDDELAERSDAPKSTKQKLIIFARAFFGGWFLPESWRTKYRKNKDRG